MSRVSRRDREAFAKLDAIYARLPHVQCQGTCSFNCGPVPLTDLEARRLQLASHHKPRTIQLRMIPPGERDERQVEQCVYLRQGRCSVYDVRPLICRVWGVVKMLSCQHGCVPARWLSDLEFLDVACAVERIGGGRVLRTAPEGLTHEPGDSYARIAAAKVVADLEGYGRSAAELDADAERTRGLRAIFGGRIVRAIREDR